MSTATSKSRKKSFLRVLLGLALLPIVWGSGAALVKVITEINPTDPDALLSKESIALFSGFMSFILLWLVMPRPTRTYVLGHELTHAIWGLMFGAKVSNLKVTASGGSVNVSKSNIWIMLAPYFFPFYTIIIVAIALITSIFVNPLPCAWAWLAAVGFTWSFHCCFTVQTLMMRQPDVVEYGRILSWTVILIFNIIGVILWIVATTNVGFLSAVEHVFEQSVRAYMAIGSFSIAVFRRILLSFS